MPSVTQMNKKQMEVKSFFFHVTETKEETRNGQKVGIITGIASTFDKDRGDDIVLPGAFTETIARHKENNRPVRMLFQHWTENLIGGFPIDQVQETEKGLEVVGEINLLPGHLGEWAYSLAKQDVLTDFSIGFRIIDEEFRDGIRFIKKLELFEISMVNEPMNPNAVITSVKSMDGAQAKETLVAQVKEYSASLGLDDPYAGAQKTVLNLEDVNEIKTIRDFEKALNKSGLSQKAAKHMAHIAKSNQWDADSGSNRRDVGSDKLLSELDGLKKALSKN